MSKHSRTKGHDFQRQIARDMTATRRRKYDTSRALAPHRDHEGVDVLSADDVFVLQAKVGKQPRVRAALEEVMRGVRPDPNGSLASRKSNNRAAPRATSDPNGSPTATTSHENEAIAWAEEIKQMAA